VVLTKDKNVMRGAQLTVNLVTGVAQLGWGTGVSGVHGGGGGRVQGLFTPPPQSGGK
jgi:lipopolysaccharide export system protein LptA